MHNFLKIYFQCIGSGAILILVEWKLNVLCAREGFNPSTSSITFFSRPSAECRMREYGTIVNGTLKTFYIFIRRMTQGGIRS